MDLVVGISGLLTLVESLKIIELRSEAALGGGVDDEDDFVRELREGVVRAALWGVVSGGERIGWRNSGCEMWWLR